MPLTAKRSSKPHGSSLKGENQTLERACSERKQRCCGGKVSLGLQAVLANGSIAASSSQNLGALIDIALRADDLVIVREAEDRQQTFRSVGNML